MNVYRFVFMLVLLLLMAPYFGYCQSSQPNIVFIIADDVGWADIGYNNPEVKTPNLDRLCSEGLRFTNNYAMSTCTPTRVGIMTGHFPSRYGVYGPDYGKIFRDDTITLPMALQEAGYHTAIAGKWHMGSPPEYTPLKYGFISSYGYFAGQIDPYTHLYKTGIPTWHRNDKYLVEVGHVTDLITDEAIRVIDESNNKPFFLYVAYSVPHFPLDEPEEYNALYSHIKPESRQWFDASMTHMDDGIGRIVNALDRNGIRKNTLLVFVSDNGGQKSWSSPTQYRGRYADKPHTVLGKNKPLRGWKGDVYEGGIRVPAFINWPGHVHQGTFETPIHFADWMPTLCAVTGTKTSRNLEWDGANMWPSIKGAKILIRRPMYWSTRNMRAVRMGDWKLIQSTDGEKNELYNVRTDPYEKTDLIQQEETKVQQLTKLMNDMVEKDRPKETD
jgi:arylsulfatase A-like enzyme